MDELAFLHFMTKYCMMKAIRMEKVAKSTRMTAAHCSSLSVLVVLVGSVMSLLVLDWDSFLCEMKRTVAL